MGMIQQSINQTLSLAGFMYSQTEGAKTRQKARQLEEEYNRLEKAYDEADLAKVTDPEDLLKIGQQWEEVGRQLYQLKPNEVTYDKWGYAGGGVVNAEGIIASREAKAEAKAEEEAEIASRVAEDSAEMAKRAKAEAEDEKAYAKASQTIQSALKDPFAIADEELQRAVQRKNEIERRKKGGMML